MYKILQHFERHSASKWQSALHGQQIKANDTNFITQNADTISLCAHNLQSLIQTHVSILFIFASIRFVHVASVSSSVWSNTVHISYVLPPLLYIGARSIVPHSSGLAAVAISTVERTLLFASLARRPQKYCKSFSKRLRLRKYRCRPPKVLMYTSVIKPAVDVLARYATS